MRLDTEARTGCAAYPVDYDVTVIRRWFKLHARTATPGSLLEIGPSSSLPKTTGRFLVGTVRGS
ncbi:MAG: hypothetical protein ACJ735_06250 [Actinomycetes bacterium]